MTYVEIWLQLRVVDKQKERIEDLECALNARDQLRGVTDVTAIPGLVHHLVAGDVLRLRRLKPAQLEIIALGPCHFGVIA